MRPRTSSKPVFSTLEGPLRDAGGHARGFANLFGAEIVAVGVAGALARDHAHADAQGNALGRALDDGFIDAELAGGEVFEVEVGVLAAGAQGFREVRLQIVLGDAELLAKEGVGKGHACNSSVTFRVVTGWLRRSLLGDSGQPVGSRS